MNVSAVLKFVADEKKLKGTIKNFKNNIYHS